MRTNAMRHVLSISLAGVTLGLLLLAGSYFAAPVEAHPLYKPAVYAENVVDFQIGPYEVWEYTRNGQRCSIVRHTRGAMARNGITMACQ